MASHEELRNIVNDKHRAIEDEARPDAVDYQHRKGKLTARERISTLCDADSFVEFGGLALLPAPKPSAASLPGAALN